MNTQQLTTALAKYQDDMGKVIARMNKAKQPDPKDAALLREMALRFPAYVAYNSITRTLREALIAKMAGGPRHAILQAEVELLKRQLSHESAPPVEALLIDHILSAWLRLTHLEHTYTMRVVDQPVPLAEGEYWDDLLSSAQARFLRAVETLGRVRRLARNTPALQINIAHAGGQQVNLLGNVNGQKGNGAHCRTGSRLRGSVRAAEKLPVAAMRETVAAPLG